MTKFSLVLWSLMFFLINPCYSKEEEPKVPDVVLKIEFYEQKANGDYTSFLISKGFMLKIEDEDGGSVTKKIKINTSTMDLPLGKGESAAFDYNEGKKIKFQVLPELENNSRWKIVSPANGEVFLPGSLSNPVRVVFKRAYPLYAVQVISTENETTASRLRDRLNEDMSKYSKFCLKIDKNCIKNVFQKK